MKTKFMFVLMFLMVSVCALAQEAKYIFLFIGDGLAMPQISTAEIYTASISEKDVTVKKLAFTQFPASGMMTTYDAGSFITDSASAGTAMASGNKTINGVINMDPGKKQNFKPITYDMKDKGYRIGIVSSVSLDHATPAAFYASVPSRGNMYDIGVQLAQSGFDYYAGGGFTQRKGKDGSLKDLHEIFVENGYTLADTRTKGAALKNGQKAIYINETLQDSMSMPYELDRQPSDLSLADHTRKAIEMLDNPNGFFLMVEGGKIDWACHANDAAASIHDTIAFDNAVKEALKFYEEHPNDTVIIVTGDHETGGMSIGFAGTEYTTFFDKVYTQKASFTRFNEEALKPFKKASEGKNTTLNDIKGDIQKYFGLTLEDLSPDELAQIEMAFHRSMGGELENTSNEMLYLLFGGYEPLTVKLTQIMNQRAGIGWTTYAHTGVPVPVFATGADYQSYGGYYDNTDIYKKLAASAGLTPVRTAKK